MNANDMGSFEESTFTPNCNVPNIDFLKHPPYFVTTLGQAKHLNTLYGIDKGHGWEDNITALVDSRAESYPDVPIVGEFLPPISGNRADEWTSRCFSECLCMLARSTTDGCLRFFSASQGDISFGTAYDEGRNSYCRTASNSWRRCRAIPATYNGPTVP